MSFYFIFPTYEEAAAALPEFQSDDSKKLLEQAEEHRRRSEESFQRSDTDWKAIQKALNIPEDVIIQHTSITAVYSVKTTAR